jgi:hypothetical protein
MLSYTRVDVPSMTETFASQPMRRVEDWKSRLIDLSRKNNLLYFRKTKRGRSLTITQPEPQKIFNSLVLKKQRLEFWLPPETAKEETKPEPPKNQKTAKTKATMTPKVTVKVKAKVQLLRFTLKLPRPSPK